MKTGRTKGMVLAGAAVIGLLVVLAAARIHTVHGQREGDSPSDPRYTVGMTEGDNLIVTDNSKNMLYFYTVDKDKLAGSDLKLRGQIDLGQVGKLTVKPTSEGEASTKKGTAGGKVIYGAGGQAYVTVVVPVDAAVFFDGEATSLTGGRRTFVSPPLEQGKKYRYEVTARWKVDGKQVEQTRTVPVTAGARVSVNFLAREPGKSTDTDKVDETGVFEAARDAYIYGYPLVTMEMTRRVMTNVAKPDGKHAPVGQFANMRSYPNSSFRDVTAPNADTLYSAAWLDLAKEPYILSLPNEERRFYLMPMLDAWTNVFTVPGTRTTGTEAQTYAITGPFWKGGLPEGVKELRSPTNMVWILGRTYCTGTPDDYKAVHDLQDKYSLVPLSAYGKPYTPPEGKVDPSIDMKTPVREQVNKMDVGAYFKLVAELMKDNPAAAADAPMVAKMAKFGLVPGKEFDIDRLDPAVVKELKRAHKAALETIEAQFKTMGKTVNGWEIFLRTGLYGTDYAQRAFITMIGLGANRPQDAVYPTSKLDAEGKPYSGAKKYVMRFAKGQLPPVNGFWSLTMYDAGFFFVENPLNRYTLSQRNKLKENADGSIDLYIQNENPGEAKEANWLPAPKGEFNLMLRLYWPKEKDPSILDGTWKPPAVRVGAE
jgi:uncharacterized protein (TIGR03000 family)